MRRLILGFLASAVIYGAANAQPSCSLNNAPCSGAAAVNGVQPDANGNIALAIPTPSTAIGPAPSTNGSVGTSPQYVPADSAPKHAVQRLNTTLATNCSWSATFNQAFVSSVPIIQAEPVQPSGSTQPVDCKVLSRSNTTQTGTCYMTQSILGLGVLPFQSTTCTAMPLMVIGGEPTQ